MGLLSSSSQKERKIAIFDIGSGSVGGAIAHIPGNPNGVPTIVKGARVEIALHTPFDFNSFLAEMQKALDTAAKTLLEAHAGALDEIVCVLASPWYVSETRVVKMEKMRSFLFTKKSADELLAKEMTLLKEAYQKKYGAGADGPVMIEHHVMGVSLNGYPVDEPLGKRTKSIEMNMIVSLAPKFCLDKIRETLAQTFHHTPIGFSSFVVASYLAVRDKYISPDSYVLIDIGGEVTDVAIVSKGILRASLSFPYGRNTLFKYICDNRSIAMRDAQELFGLWSTKTLDKDRREKAAPLFQAINDAWSSALRESINALPHALTLPSTVFLTADPDIAEWFSDIICNDGYTPSLNGGQKCAVVTLEGPEFLSMCNFKQGFCDPFLMIEAIAIMRKKVPVEA